MDPDLEDKFLKDKSADADNGGDDADSYSRKARTLIYLVAAGFLIVGTLNIAAYLLKCRHDQAAVNLWRCLYLSIPLVIGLAILIKSSALARRIEDWLEQ